MKLRIVPMTAEHLPAVAALEKICFPADPWSNELFREALENPSVAVLLAQRADGAILGYAVLSAVLDEGNLDNIAVARPARRRLKQNMRFVPRPKGRSAPGASSACRRAAPSA